MSIDEIIHTYISKDQIVNSIIKACGCSRKDLQSHGCYKSTIAHIDIIQIGRFFLTFKDERAIYTGRSLVAATNIFLVGVEEAARKLNWLSIKNFIK